MVNFIEGKAYPSTAVPNAVAWSDGSRPRLSPNECRQWERDFKNIPDDKLPVLRREHDRSTSGQIGVVTDLFFNESDKWLHMQARCRGDRQQLIRDYLNDDGEFCGGLSLSYSLSSRGKKLTEISVVEDPDFEGAEIEYFHSESGETHFVCPLSKARLAFDIFFKQHSSTSNMAEDDGTLLDDFNPETHSFTTDEGSIVIWDERYLNDAQAYALKQGKEASAVECEHIPDSYKGFTEEQKRASMAITIAENRRLNAALGREERNRREQAAKEALQKVLPLAERATRSLADDGDTRNGATEVIAKELLNNPNMQILAHCYDDQLTQHEKEIANLKAQLATATSGARAPSSQQRGSAPNQCRPNFPNGQEALFDQVMFPQHSSGSASKRQAKDASSAPLNGHNLIWNMLEERFSRQGSSGSSGSRKVQDDGDDAQPEFKEHSGAKRGQPTPKPIASPFVYGGWNLIPKQAPSRQSSRPSSSSSSSLGDSDTPRFFAHSRAKAAAITPRYFKDPLIDSIASHPGLAETPRGASEETLVRAKLADVLTGRFPICDPGHQLPHNFVDDNLLVVNPPAFAGLIHGLIDGNISTNRTSGVLGYSDPNWHVGDAVLGRISQNPEAMAKYCVPLDEISAHADRHFASVY